MLKVLFSNEPVIRGRSIDRMTQHQNQISVLSIYCSGSILLGDLLGISKNAPVCTEKCQHTSTPTVIIGEGGPSGAKLF